MSHIWKNSSSGGSLDVSSLIKLSLPQSALLIDWRGGLFPPLDMICYLNDQVIAKEVVVRFQQANHPLPCALQFPLWFGARSQHRHRKRSSSPHTMQNTSLISSYFRMGGEEHNISGKFLSLLTSAYTMAFLKMGGCRCNVWCCLWKFVFSTSQNMSLAGFDTAPQIIIQFFPLP